MTWNSEAEFVKSFLSTTGYLNRSNKNDYEVWTEVKTGFGRPDVVIIEYNQNVLEERRRYDQKVLAAPLSTRTAFALSYLSTCRWVKIDSLGKFLNVTRTQLVSVVQELQSRGLIETKEHLLKLKPKSEILAVNRVRVFEAKLTHWMEAIEQAERHLWFTYDSYILMPNIEGKRVNSITLECDKRGIGLSFFDLDAGFSTVLKPAQSGVQNSPMLWQINERLVGGVHGREPVFS